VRTTSRLAFVELKLFSREPLTVVFALALPLLTLFVLGGVFGNEADPDFYRGFGPMDYYTPAYVGLVLASIGVLSIPTHLASNRERGVLRRFRAFSVSLWAVVGAEVLVSLCIAVVSTFVLVVASVMVYDVSWPQSPALFVAALGVSSLCFASIGVLLGSLMPSARAAQAAGMLLWFTMLFVGGAGPPPEVLNAPLRAMGSATPLKPVAITLQDAWLGLGWNWGEVGILSAVMAACGLAIVYLFRWE
jgi:ABC-2 type transport system permease protein